MDATNELVRRRIISVRNGTIHANLPRLRDFLSTRGSSNYNVTIQSVIAAYKHILNEYRYVAYKCDIQSLSVLDLRLLDFVYQLFPALVNSDNFAPIFNVLKPFLYMYYNRKELDDIIVLK